jgi:hypothetical protein
MRRDQLEHAIRTACQIIQADEVIVVGSQSILGTYREDELVPGLPIWRRWDGALELDVAVALNDRPECRGRRSW